MFFLVILRYWFFQNDFEIRSTNAVQNMRTACEFAARFNVPFYEDDRHFDFAIIFTRKKFGYSGSYEENIIVRNLVYFGRRVANESVSQENELIIKFYRNLCDFL